ncbi:MAG: hypothetical protein IKV15_02225 [Bacteroidaceae bacterium]|nr:hypothetical protein [Bacteroidaceae bacterium]
MEDVKVQERDFNLVAKILLGISMVTTGMGIFNCLLKFGYAEYITINTTSLIIKIVLDVLILIAGFATFFKNKWGLIALSAFFVIRMFATIPLDSNMYSYQLGGNMVHLFRDFGLFAIAMCFKKDGISGWKSIFASPKNILVSENDLDEKSAEDFSYENIQDTNANNKVENGFVASDEKCVNLECKVRDFNLVAKILLGLSMFSVLFFMIIALQDLIEYKFQEDVLEVVFDVLILVAGVLTFIRLKVGAVALIVLFVARMFFAVDFNDLYNYECYFKDNVIAFFRDFGLFAFAMFFKKDGVSGWRSMLASIKHSEGKMKDLSAKTKGISVQMDKQNKIDDVTKKQSVSNVRLNGDFESKLEKKCAVIVKSNFEFRFYKEKECVDGNSSIYSGKVQISLPEENEFIEIENQGNPEYWSQGRYKLEIWYKNKKLYSQAINIC